MRTVIPSWRDSNSNAQWDLLGFINGVHLIAEVIQEVVLIRDANLEKHSEQQKLNAVQAYYSGDL